LHIKVKLYRWDGHNFTYQTFYYLTQPSIMNQKQNVDTNVYTQPAGDFR
jgi:hypothetical protein